MLVSCRNWCRNLLDGSAGVWLKWKGKGRKLSLHSQLNLLLFRKMIHAVKRFGDRIAILADPHDIRDLQYSLPIDYSVLSETCISVPVCCAYSLYERYITSWQDWESAAIISFMYFLRHTDLRPSFHSC